MSTITTTSRPEVTHDQFLRLKKRVQGRVEDAEEMFQDYADKYGVPSALDNKVNEVREAQGYDDYTRKLRGAVDEFFEETEDGSFRVHVQSFENAVEAQREKIEDDAIRDWTVSEPDNGERSYKEGRRHALNAVEYCESLIEDLKS